MDNYTRFLLTVIAVSLAVIALRGNSPIAEAQAADSRCVIDGPMEISKIDDTIRVKVEQGFAQPGTSSSNPVYVEMVGK
jgi:hypothetical protein